VEGGLQGHAADGEVNRFRIALLALLALLVVCPASAAPRKAVVRNSPGKQPAPVQSAYRRTPYVGAVAADAATGKVLFSDRADAEAYPASVTKLMTLLLVMEDVKAGKYALTDRVVATADVNNCEPSWVGIRSGESMSVCDLCYALMVESANDAAIVLGVHAAGSFDAFVARMNARAKELGMTHTAYYNPNGLPPSSRRRYPWKKFNSSTAADQLKLALVLVKMPEVLRFTAVKTCDLVRSPGGYRIEETRRVGVPNRVAQLAEGEQVVKQFRNHNNLMVKDKLKIINPDGSEAVDGLKTGYIDAGGSSVVLTAKRNGRRVVAVVLGSSSAAERDAVASRILSDALAAAAW